MSSSRTLSRKFRTSFTCIKPRFDPSIILLYIAASVEQYCDITQVNALPENEGILERSSPSSIFSPAFSSKQQPEKPLIRVTYFEPILKTCDPSRVGQTMAKIGRVVVGNHFAKS